MSKQTDYTPQEWKALATAPMLAGLVVTVSDLSGPLGTLKEALAVAKGVAETAESTSSEILKALAEGIRAQGSRPDMPDLPKDQEGARAVLIDACKQAAAVVAQKSPAEAEEYKRWLVLMAKKTAEAAKEGGFLGIGGTRVSEWEATAIKELSTALGVSV